MLPEQQPAQLPGPQTAAWHVPPWQTLPVPAQLLHWMPARPHAVSWLPVAQMSAPMQQPAQLAGLQLGAGVQMPLLQVSFGGQLLQTSPLLPQAAGVVATTQLLPTQQPGQFPALHVGWSWHVRSFGCPCGMHVLPMTAQLEHACPCLPHAV